MKKKLAAIFFLIGFSAILIKVMVFKNVPLIKIGPMMLNFGGTQEGHANLTPFKTILPYLLGEKGFIIGGINIVGNIILLVPIGFLVPFIFRKMNWKRTIPLAIAAGLSIEIMQVILHVGIFDIDDVILNAVGVMIGYWVFTILPHLVQLMKSYKVATAIILAGCLALVFYGISFLDNGPHRRNSLPDLSNGNPQHFENRDRGNVQGNDPCGGTGGTGQILTIGRHSFNLKRRDGMIQMIMLSDQTKLRNSVGNITEADLKIGERVTIVSETQNQDGSMNASFEWVCN
jgi:glycopeptide antibiotics resistance protein